MLIDATAYSLRDDGFTSARHHRRNAWCRLSEPGPVIVKKWKYCLMFRSSISLAEAIASRATRRADA